MITLIFNEHRIHTESNTTLKAFLKRKQVCEPYAVILNGRVIQKEEQRDYQLNDQDILDVIVPMQGG